MASTSRGTHGQPIITPAPRTIGDLQAISDFAGTVGTRVIADTAADMGSGFEAKFGFAPYDGLECFIADVLDTYTYRGATGQWVLANAPDPTGTSGIFTPSTGWAMGDGSQSMTLGNGFCQVYVSFKRTGGALAVPADGNVGGSVAVGRLLQAPRQSSGLPSGAAGRMSSFLVDSTGLVTLSATTPGGSIATNDYLSFAGLYMI